MSKIKVSVVFGGRSGEHEVSLVSAGAVIEALDKNKYEVWEVGIGHDGCWYTGADCLKKFKSGDYSDLHKLVLSTDPEDKNRPDIVFPVLHGSYGEDGRIQGLLEMLDLPYVGCEVMAASVGMDKVQSKKIWDYEGVAVVPWIDFKRFQWKENPEMWSKKIVDEIGFPCFVKPVNMGSSVGITKVKSLEGLKDAIDLAAKFDKKIMVEKGLNVREIECAVLGNDHLESGPLGEVIVGGEFYDFNDKYLNGVSKSEIPAKIDQDLAKRIKESCLKAYQALDCTGLARVDSFVDVDSGEIYMNEINTMPGFTSISMYPQMMKAHGLEYSSLVDRLIELGFARYQEKRENQLRFDSESDWFK